MAVAATLPNYKAFTFDGASSRSYGVYITGEGVFNAPERAVEMVSIPGRNGAYALDKGYFENIEVTYPAGIFAETESDFAQAVSDFRNFLCSKKGYCRLQDEYNPNEYRMAIYKSGLEVDHEGLLNGEFNIVFECKPQRWLTSGETKLSVANNGTINNPTLFEASPLLMVDGYGTINIGDQTIEVENALIGNVLIANAELSASKNAVEYNNSVFRTGDTITCESRQLYCEFNNSPLSPIASYSIDSTSGYAAALLHSLNNGKLNVSIGYGLHNFTQGTAADLTSSVTITVTYDDNTTGTFTITSIYTYDGTDEFAFNYSFSGSKPQKTSVNGIRGEIHGDSTISVLGTPMYIDLDIGEAYKYESGSMVSSNNGVSFGSELATLKPGVNVITYSNTFVSFELVPRWWVI